MATNLRNLSCAASLALIAIAGARATADERDTSALFAHQDVSETVASHGLVTGTTGAAAQEAGIRMLKAGGTAADAVVATAMTQVCLAAGSWVSYAGLMNVIYYDAESDRVFNMNASYDTVEEETDAASIPKPDFSKGLSGVQLEPTGRSVLVPGFLKGAEALVERFGNLPLETVVAPSVRCAEDGFALPAGMVQQLEFRRDVLSRDPETRAIYFKDDGSDYAADETFKQPALAETLARFGREGADYIYKGPWAEKLVRKTRELGGKLSMRDMETYDVIWGEPVHAAYHGYEVYSHGLPAAGGVNTLEALALADLVGLADMPHYSESAESTYWLSVISGVAIPLTYGAAALGEALQMDLSYAARLKPETSAALWEVVKSGHFPGVTPPVKPAHSDGVVVVDEHGNVAAMVHSINTVSWGTNGLNIGGISIPDSAVIQVDAVAATVPGERLTDPTNPGLIMKDGQPYVGYASIGAGLHQRTTAALISIMDFGMTPQEAIDAPAFGARAFGGGTTQTFGAGELSDEMKTQLEAMGMGIEENDAMRGYWVGIMIEPETGRLLGGGPREFDISMGGRAVGY